MRKSNRRGGEVVCSRWRNQTESDMFREWITHSLLQHLFEYWDSGSIIIRLMLNKASKTHRATPGDELICRSMSPVTVYFVQVRNTMKKLFLKAICAKIWIKETKVGYFLVIMHDTHPTLIWVKIKLFSFVSQSSFRSSTEPDSKILQYQCVCVVESEVYTPQRRMKPELFPQNFRVYQINFL